MKMPATSFETTGTALPSVAIVAGLPLPKQVGTKLSHVAALLVSGRRLTNGCILAEASSSRGAAIVDVLRDMGWPIVARTIVTECADGSKSRIAEYSLSDSVISAAMEDGAAEWCDRVFEARRQRRRTARGWK